MKYFIPTPSTFSHIVLFSWETIIIADYWLDFGLVVKLGKNIKILNINGIKLYLCSSKQKSSEDCRKTLSEEIPLKTLWQRYEINPIYSNRLHLQTWVFKEYFNTSKIRDLVNL